MTKRCIILMGVSGSGKTVIGQQIAEKLDARFVDADDFHPSANIIKMSSGIPLTDADRIPWLNDLGKIASTHLQENQMLVMACSALKRSYRDILRAEISGETMFIYLKSSFEEIAERLQKRVGHFMPKGLLESQFEALDEPLFTEKNLITIDASPAVDEVTNNCIDAINNTF
ncbi:gluconokinase [Pedobacter punctiformis]|uniref:Gluconokinase n=1 Tax=Pedobacter punctiformis TaxID=3004097 RepID=A0ABT4LBW7_9SPHI|nr:gluconokinase [Pedobacter sp. HCMS5-2]MCZ4245416.1 gluconokinase [Pedobacter sp. HCMS5-2]